MEWQNILFAGSMAVTDGEDHEEILLRLSREQREAQAACDARNQQVFSSQSTGNLDAQDGYSADLWV